MIGLNPFSQLPQQQNFMQGNPLSGLRPDVLEMILSSLGGGQGQFGAPPAQLPAVQPQPMDPLKQLLQPQVNQVMPGPIPLAAPVDPAAQMVEQLKMAMGIQPPVQNPGPANAMPPGWSGGMGPPQGMAPRPPVGQAQLPDFTGMAKPGSSY